MDELTEAEREAIWESLHDGGTLAAVARIKADAHAAGVAEGRAEALPEAAVERAANVIADYLSDTGISDAHRQAARAALRAALAGTSPQGEGERTHPLEIAHCPHRPFGICGACIPIGGPDPHDHCDDASGPQPGTLEYAQMVAERYGDLDDAAIEDGMEPAGTSPQSDSENWCACNAYGGRVHPHDPDRKVHQGRPCPPERVDPIAGMPPQGNPDSHEWLGMDR